MVTDYKLENLHKEDKKLYESLDKGDKLDKVQSLLMKCEHGNLKDEYIVKYKPILVTLFDDIFVNINRMSKDYRPEDDIKAIDRIFEEYNITKGQNLSSIDNNHFDIFSNLLCVYFLDWQVEQYYFYEAYKKLEKIVKNDKLG